MPVTDPEQDITAAKAACDVRLTEVECELKVTRLEREEKEDAEERTEARKRAEDERLARERTVEAWRQAESQRRQERREDWRRFWGKSAGSKEEPQSQGQSGTLRVLVALGIPAGVALFIYALAAGPPAVPEGTVATDPNALEILALGLLTAAASFAVGALLGFLFGIPRSIAHQAEEKGAEADGKRTEAEAAAARNFTANTNLEQISDWLTKILVGVGLVQIHQVGGAINDLANGLAPGLGAQGFAVAVALLVSFSITGFVSAYLYTRLRLQSAFELASVIKQAVKEQANTETNALALVREQLTPGVDNRPTLASLTEALKEATVGVRKQAFFLARGQRLEKLAEEGSAEEEEEFSTLSVPVFKALIACETEEHYYRVRAELAYALLESSKPNFAAAKAALDEAIKLRDPADAIRTPRYELYRAYCTVGLQAGSGVSPDPVIDEVCDDLEAGIRAGGKLDEDKLTVIEEWLKRNSEPASTPAQIRAAGLLQRIREQLSSNR